MTKFPKLKISVAKGDGIGPEIMEAVLSIFNAVEVPLDYEYVDMGLEFFEKGFNTGMTPEAMASIENNGILFKGPMETPKGKGVKSINVTARKVWNTYCNVRKFKTFQGVDTVFSKAGIPINMTVLRENIEDTYGGIEYLHTPEVAVNYRLITRPGSEQFIRFAFEYARREGIGEITCGHKSNIMKLTDGIFMNVFYEVAKEYPDIKVNDLIVDDLAMKLVRFPDRFKIIILTNLQGDIISDLCAGLVGGLGFAPSANVGDNISIFEAVHGTAPDIAGQNKANPTSLLLSGLMMLRHLGFISYADKIENALLHVLENGIHTGDFGTPGSPNLGTKEFAKAIIEHIGQVPTGTEVVNTGTPDFVPVRRPKPHDIHIMSGIEDRANELVIGADMYIDNRQQSEEVAELIQAYLPAKLTLKLISNRGTQVWPTHSVYTESVAHYRCRIELRDKVKEKLTRWELLTVIALISETLRVANIEILREWGDLKGYSLAQGQ